MQENLPKRVHIVEIAGLATSALAIAFHKAGVKVTGSDKGFFLIHFRVLTSYQDLLR
jgi:UDP-N-acetylmuramate-alanine ligase